MRGKYNLYLNETVMRDKTLLSYYFRPNFRKVKTSERVVVDGECFRLDLVTGEVDCYKKGDVLKSGRVSIARSRRLLKVLLEVNDFSWFCTLTFDPLRVDRRNDKEVYDCYRRFIERINRKYPLFRYVCVPERHEDGCFHFHLLIGGLTPEQMGLSDSGKVCCHWATRKNGVCSRSYFEKTASAHELEGADGQTVYNITKFEYGLTTATRIVDREKCGSYVLKYIEKDFGSTDVFKKRFYYSRNLKFPRVVKSLVGEGFSVPEPVGELSCVMNSNLVKGSDYVRVNDYNVMQAVIDNGVKGLVALGLEVVTGDEAEIAYQLFREE